MPEWLKKKIKKAPTYTAYMRLQSERHMRLEINKWKRYFMEMEMKKKGSQDSNTYIRQKDFKTKAI